MSNLFRGYLFTPAADEEDLMWFLNFLPVKLIDFAVLSNLEARAYGVKTYCDTCRDDSDCPERQWLNQCARDHVWDILVSVQQNLMALKRVTLGPTYHTETALWYPGKMLQTKFPYIESINVQPVFTELDVVSVSPFIATSLTTNATANFVEAKVPLDVVHNPVDVVMREESMQFNATAWHMRIPLDSQWGYPFKNATDWTYAMQKDVNLASDLNAQDCNYVFVDIDPVADQVISDIVFMHPEQDQLIPQVLPPQTIVATNKWRYWFYYWTLKRPEFADDKVDLTLEKEFDKFYDELRYGIIEEETAPATILLKPTDCCTTSFEDVERLAMGNIYEGEQGVVYFESARENTDTDPVTYERLCYDCSGLCDGHPYKIRFSYKTNPYHYGMYIAGIEQMRRAIVAKVAANLPLETCNCSLIEGSYIDRMREELPQVVYQPMMQPMFYTDVGWRRGDREFAHAMNNLSIKKRSVLL